MRTYPLRQMAIARASTLAIVALVFFALTAATASVNARSATEGFADLAERLLPSVVNISSTQTIKRTAQQEIPGIMPGSPFEEFFRGFSDRMKPQNRAERATSLGSGFIISEDGYVVTNNHVIDGADEITVILSDNQRLKAKLVGRDPKTDLALLKVNADKPLKAVRFGDSDKARVGDWVVAIGNPFGLGGTVTSGIISARGRDIHAGPYDDFIQTDASINKGNSGGPMFNDKGEVIGVNSAIYSPSGGSVGIGFAIPASTVKPIISQLRDHGQIRRGWLGVQIQPVTDEIAESLGLKTTQGALVASVVDDGPAAKANLRAGDVIMKFNGEEVSEMRLLPRIVAEAPIDTAVRVEFWRHGKQEVRDVRIEELKDNPQLASNRDDQNQGGDPSAPGLAHFDELGMTLSSLTEPLRQRFEIGKDVEGLLVTGVDDNGSAVEKGLRAGDVIVQAAQEATSTPAQFAETLKEAKMHKQKSVLLLVQGQQGQRYVALKIKTA